jgi:hypothetical protein
MGKTKLKGKPADDLVVDKAGYGGRKPDLVVVEGIPDAETKARTVAKRNTNHCTLCRLHHLGHLRDRPSDDLKQASLRHAAGEKLQDDHALAGLTCIPGTMSRLMGAGGRGGGADISQTKIDASKRKKDALSAVGLSARFLLENIVIEDMTLTQVSGLMEVNHKAVLPALRVALDALAAHYGLGAVASARVRGGAARPIHPFQKLD